MIILEMMVSGRDRFDRKFKKWKFKKIKCPQVALKKYYMSLSKEQTLNLF